MLGARGLARNGARVPITGPLGPTGSFRDRSSGESRARMSRNVIEMDAPIDAVFEVLLDPEAYPQWVVGAKRLRDVDDNWPAPGSSFHHAVGAGPAEVRDATTVREIDPPRRLVLDSLEKNEHFINTFELEPQGSGTRLTRTMDAPRPPFPVPAGCCSSPRPSPLRSRSVCRA